VTAKGGSGELQVDAGSGGLQAGFN
jgi:hypothetical protein